MNLALGFENHAPNHTAFPVSFPALGLPVAGKCNRAELHMELQQGMGQEGHRGQRLGRMLSKAQASGESLGSDTHTPSSALVSVHGCPWGS